MIKIIAGEKGTGKTATLVEAINAVATEDNNVVCIERGNRLDQLLKHNVRLINMEEYPVKGFDQLLAFIAGICSKDYDLTHIYIDSVRKVISSENIDGIEEFLTSLNAFLEKSSIIATIVVSNSVVSLPEGVKQYL
ncbi:MAG: hypothetical protein MJ166_02780 [Clostridia bacterium]|nr:hypothetical protein [Clostridia bacterium]